MMNHFFVLFVCLICSLRPSQQSFSYNATGLPGFMDVILPGLETPIDLPIIVIRSLPR